MNRKVNDTKSDICADLKDPRDNLQAVGACPTLELCCAYKWGFLVVVMFYFRNYWLKVLGLYYIVNSWFNVILVF